MADVVAIGELLIDFTIKDIDKKGYPTMAAHPGGAPANFLASVRKYGISAGMIGKVGNDFFGRKLIATLNDIGIETNGILKSEDFFTTLAFVTLNDDGEREFSFARKPGADTQIEFEEINKRIIDDCKDFHFGSLSLTNEPSRSATYNSVMYAKEKGKLLSYDPNYRSQLWSSIENARKQIIWGIEQADILKISNDEIDFLFGITDPEEGARLIFENYNSKIVFVTCGSDGAVFINKSGCGKVGCPKVHSIDTTGAGDIFGGSVLAGILKSNKRPENLTLNDLRRITEFSCTAASLSTEISGGISSLISKEIVDERIHTDENSRNTTKKV